MFEASSQDFSFSPGQTSADRVQVGGEAALRRGSLLLVRRLVRLHGRAGAHQVLVAVDVVDPGDARPEFGLGSDVRLRENQMGCLESRPAQPYDSIETEQTH